MPAWPYEIPLRYNVALRQHADFVISNDTFDEILCKVFENTSLLFDEGD